MKHIAVIGGGASGLMASCYAARHGNRVTLFEKQKCIGRKILVTGNGRCNIANIHLDPGKYNGRNPRIIHNIFSRFGLQETIDFFTSIGIPLVEGKDGKLFPASLQSSSVTRVFEYEIAKRGVEVKLHRRIDSISMKKNRFILETAGNESYNFDAVILSPGSSAYPQVGGTDQGYELASSLNHTVSTPFPAILPINIPLRKIHRLEGIKWDCAISVLHGGKIIDRSSGELLFTKFGISGPVSLDVSRSVNALILKNEAPELLVDFFPEKTGNELREMLDSVWLDVGREIGFSLTGVLKQRMPEVILELAGIDPLKKVSEITAADKKIIIQHLKGLCLEPGKPRGFNEAVVAAGGINVDEIDPVTMESRIVPGLYITGEVLDIDGRSGGYNLQFAWSTGAIAGMSV